jgi:hypothetical protein
VPFSVDLEGLFSGAYELRLPLLVGAAVLGALVAVVAIRGRWDRGAARHPVATGVVVAALVIVGLPVAWYLGSPLFLSSELIEPVPAAVADADPSPSDPPVTPAPSGPPAPSSPSQAPGGSSAVPTTPTASPTASAPGAATETRGTFSGTDDFHFGRGTARLIVAADGSAIVRFEKFAVRNGPDLYVYLSPHARRYVKGAVELGRLKADRGSFNYRVPAGTDLSKARSVVIWCKQFSFQFAVAPLP